ncbi:MAG: stage II sporulation protein M [Deltaproteobacteria bacterium]|nr:stage II sporulation protein M [Deltaproteobacteria bacterium]MBN2671623.1 stage II sporulation protein M [Deltaproteobacteria bacterium]
MSNAMDARKARWGRLEKLLGDLEARGTVKATESELDEFVHLYRTACGDLAKVRSDSPGHNIEEYLNHLVARGHKLFRTRESGSSGAVIRFFTHDFPAEVRALGWHLWVAVLLFAVPLIAASILVYLYPQNAYSLASPEELEMLARAYAEGHAGGRSESLDTFMAGFYINHNVSIAFQCFATGVFAGIGAAFALLFNGVAIGAIGGFICASGYTTNFISFVCGHGAFELTAIVLCGATGLRLGMLLVNPGRWSRLDALKINSAKILKVVLGSAVMLTIAAFIEAFWSPSSAPAVVKYAVAAVLWSTVIVYLAWAGRTNSQQRDNGETTQP